MADVGRLTTLSGTARRLAAGIGVGLAAGLVLGAIVVVSHSLFGGRPLAFWMENTAGPWFATAFVAGALTRRPAIGATAGAVALLLAVVMDDSISFVTGDGFAIQVFAHVSPRWAAVALVVGAGVGALSGWWAADRDERWVGVSALGGLLVGESAALFVAGAPHEAFDARLGAAQAAIGVVAVIAATSAHRRWHALAATVALAAAIAATELATGLVTRLIWG